MAILFSAGCSFTSLNRADRLNAAAYQLYVQGRIVEAIPRAREALALRERVLGPDNIAVADSLSDLGALLNAAAEYAEARPLLERSLKIREKRLGSSDPKVALSLQNLAFNIARTGRVREALPLQERSLEIWRQARGVASAGFAEVLDGSAGMLDVIGDYAEARRRYEQALEIRERVLGPTHPQVAASLNNLGAFMWRTGNYTAAHPLYERALAIRRQTLDPLHPQIAESLNNLATLLGSMGEYANARPLLKEALSIWERRLGPRHPNVAQALNNLAFGYTELGEYSEARPLYERALKIREETLGPTHPDVAQSVNNLAWALDGSGDYAGAVGFAERALSIAESNFGPTHAETAFALHNLAFHFYRSKNYAAARPVFERARRVLFNVRRANPELDDESVRGILKRQDRGLSAYVTMLATIARDPSLDSTAATALSDAFVVVEQIRATAADQALMRAGARAAASDPTSWDIARQVQDLRQRREMARVQLVAEYGKSPSAQTFVRVEQLRRTVQQIDQELTTAGERLSKAFPRYAELATPEPSTLREIQGLLRADECVVSYYALPERLLIWVVRRDTIAYEDVQVTRAVLIALVARVRESLDQGQNANLSLGRLVPFDVAGSYQLYSILLGRQSASFDGVKHLMVVPDEAVLPLPFGALVTRTDSEEYRKLAQRFSDGAPLSRADLEIYSRLPWLSKDYAITVLPSATSLRALRAIERSPGAAKEPFIGFGDPELQGRGRQRGGAMLAGRGSSVEVGEIQRLPRLPGSREELSAIARALGADPDRALFLGTRATKSEVLALNGTGRLGSASVIAFATHALIAGEVGGLRQPALVLTPPSVPSDEDDGLLRLDDIVGLKLVQTDWVVLSACNTAASDGSGEGLSGLVRAFFFAGAPTLLVSHWSVEDQATRALMTEVFRRYAQDQARSRAEALRLAMLELMTSARGPNAYFAHPFAWAAFFLVGEGTGSGR
jgi:CHAT domain-containing protein/Tfp pilus assembly protein PilF